MRGLTGGKFNSASAHIFSVGFWHACFCAIGEVSNPLSLRDGEHSIALSSSICTSSLSVSSCSFQLSSTARSLHQLFLAWSSRSLKVVDQGLFFCRPSGSVSLFGSERTIGHVSLFVQFSVQYLRFVVFRLCSFAFVWLLALGIVDIFFSFTPGPLTLSAKCEKTPDPVEVEG